MNVLRLWVALYILLYYLIDISCNILKAAPLTAAVKSGDTDTVRLLIENGADISIGEGVC